MVYPGTGKRTESDLNDSEVEVMEVGSDKGIKTVAVDSNSFFSEKIPLKQAMMQR